MMNEEIELTDYQQRVVCKPGRHILYGGRQIGKTTAAVYEAVTRLLRQETVIFIGPTYQMVRQISRKIGGLVQQAVGTRPVSLNLDDMVFESGRISFFSSHQLKQSGVYPNFHGADAVIVDEANFVRDESVLFDLEQRSIEQEIDVLLTMTPRPRDEWTIVEAWAAWSSHWDSNRVATYDVPFLNEKYVDDWAEQLDFNDWMRRTLGVLG